MAAALVPIRWPGEWNRSDHIQLLQGTCFNCIVGAPGFKTPGFSQFSEDGQSGAALLDGEWPQVKMARRGESSDTAEGGPTGAPWVDSNGWRVALQKARRPDKPVWLRHAPPEDRLEDGLENSVRAYTIAIADAAAAGARWVLTLDAQLAGAMARSDPTALAAWREIAAAAGFFEKMPAAAGLRTVASLGVLSGFEGDNEFLAQEMLNLSARRHLPCRILLLENAMREAWDDLRAIVYIGPAPDDALRGRLVAFAAGGGLLIAPAFLAPPGAAAEKFGYRIHTAGKGRIATPKQEWSDPYLLAGECHMLLSRANDSYRLYNPGSVAVNYEESTDRRRARVQLLRFSGRGEGQMTVALCRKYRKAVLTSPEHKRALPIAPVAVRFGVELPLPAFSIYAAIDLQG